jgi:hypothetical protein
LGSFETLDIFYGQLRQIRTLSVTCHSGVWMDAQMSPVDAPKVVKYAAKVRPKAMKHHARANSKQQASLEACPAHPAMTQEGRSATHPARQRRLRQTVQLWRRGVSE